MNRKLWQGGKAFKAGIEPNRIMSEDDLDTDSYLIDYEILTLLAFQVELFKERKIERKKSRAIIDCLLGIRGKYDSIPADYEDVHSFIQDIVDKKIGEDADDLRLLLSRNEEIHSDLRMFYRDHIISIQEKLYSLICSVKYMENKYDGTLPGYTHYRQAMPVSIKTYADFIASVMESKIYEFQGLLKDLSLSPLGYGSGFGNLLDIDWITLAKSLGFDSSVSNPLFLASRRPIDDFSILAALSSMMLDISRISQDLIFLSSEESGIFTLPPDYVTGSSLMPNKTNPDFLEIVQGYASTFAGNLAAVASNTINKLSGYHREFQIGKKLTIDSILKMEEIIVALSDMFSKISFNKEQSGQAIRNSTYATNFAAEKVLSGNAWRDSYSEAGKRIANNEQIPSSEVKSSIVIDKKRRDKIRLLIDGNRRRVNETIKNLVKEAGECVAQIQEIH
ncbi:MAG: hypothetical protein LVQ96_07810 [Thermoplasmatales archaeon]|nr:hypothetical protein [Thermoplasmatales archaeon]MCW6171059.1 hypothetical protein [Thermoplasmatales archaeon]